MIISKFPELMRSMTVEHGSPARHYVSTRIETLAQLVSEQASLIFHVQGYQENYDLQMECISINPMCLAYINNQTVEICLVAIDQNEVCHDFCSIVSSGSRQLDTSRTVIIEKLIKKQLILDEISGENKIKLIATKMTKHLKDRMSVYL